ncbi:She4p [Sugiyamaella lignohabitans]|uniref:She4p n=1 Tax=Sugiyamaella lignohabitans TaxID=796027 RepID=A0A167FEV7_9ASCO|nr:She4p [Sugiyamaella lignohabitans]ANB15212.1 She4p [Sugiyamaella lignohabitans]
MASVDQLIEKFDGIALGDDSADEFFFDIKDNSLFADLLGVEKVRTKLIRCLVEKPVEVINFLVSSEDVELVKLTRLAPYLSKSELKLVLDEVLVTLTKIYFEEFKTAEDISKQDAYSETFSRCPYLLRFVFQSVGKLIGTDSMSNYFEKILSAIIPYSDRRLINIHGGLSRGGQKISIASQVILIISKCIEISYDETETALKSSIRDVLEKGAATGLKVSYIIVFSLVSLMFHINISIAEQIFMLDDIQVKKLTVELLNSQQFVLAALDALSSACVSKSSRALVAQNFGPLISNAFESTENQSVQILAASVLVKTSANSDGKESEKVKMLDEFSKIFEEAVGEYIQDKAGILRAVSDSDYQVALEGLAYTSLLTTAKSRIIASKNIMDNLVATFTSAHVFSQHPVWIYSSLCILVNITNYSPKLSAEQEKLRDLKSYGGKSNLESEHESDIVVNRRNKIVLETGLVGAISKSCPQFSKASKEIVSNLLRNLVTDRSHRSIFVQQGGLAVLIYLLLPPENGSTDGSKGIEPKAANITTSGLAKTLISVDPKVAFSSKLSPSVVVKPLITQLQCEASEIPLLDKFEALLALTNIASFDDFCRDQIIRLGWNKIENLVTGSNVMVQRASIELICNLAMSPLCAEKYLDGSKSAISRLELLVAFSDSDDGPTSIAAAGAMALLSEWGQPAVETMGHNSKCVQRLVALLVVPDPAIRDRAISATRNLLVGAKQNKDDEVINLFNNQNSVEKIKNMVQSTGDSDTITLALESVKILLNK